MHDNVGWCWSLSGYIYFHLLLVAQGDVVASVWMWMFFLKWCSISPQTSFFFGDVFKKSSCIFHQSCRRYTLINLIWDWEHHLFPEQPSRLSCFQAPSLTFSFLYTNPLELLESPSSPSERHMDCPQYTTIFLSPALWVTQHRSFLQSYLDQKQIWASTFMIMLISSFRRFISGSQEPCHSPYKSQDSTE